MICGTLWSHIYCTYGWQQDWLETESEFGALRQLTGSAPTELAFASYFLLVIKESCSLTSVLTDNLMGNSKTRVQIRKLNGDPPKGGGGEEGSN